MCKVPVVRFPSIRPIRGKVSILPIPSQGALDRASDAKRLDLRKFDHNRVPIAGNDLHAFHSAARQCARDWFVIGGYFRAILRPRRCLESPDKRYTAAARNNSPDERLISSELVLMD